MSRKYSKEAYNRIVFITARIEKLTQNISELQLELRKLEVEKEGLVAAIGEDAVDELKKS